MNPRITLDQWRALLAVVDSGGYAQAAEALNKSQSAVSYAIAKMEELLDLKVFELQGRKAVLTPTGELLYRRARLLVDEAGSLEAAARELAQGCEAEVGVAIDHLFPQDLLLASLGHFSDQFSQTRVQLVETVLSGNEEALITGQVDLAITPIVPVGFLGDPLMRIRFLAVANPAHPLHQLDRTLSYQDLRQSRQLVIRDSGIHMKRDAGWLGAEQRWTVSHMSSSIAAVRMGLGFAWLPELNIRRELTEGSLRPLPLQEGAERFTEIYLVFAEKDYAGPATQALARIIRQEVAQRCAAASLH